MKSNNFFSRLKSVSASVIIDIVIVFVILVSTIFPNLFDPERADWRTVLSSFLFSAIITILAFISQSSAAKKRESNTESYKESFNNHVKQIRVIQSRNLSKLHSLYIKDINDKIKMDYVHELFNQFEIDIAFYSCSQEILKKAVKENEIDKEQLSVIQLCRKNKIHYDIYDVKDLTSTQILKKNSNTNKSQSTMITVSNILSKLSMMLAFSLLFGMFIWDKENGVDFSSGQAWTNLVFRLSTFIGGLWTGDLNGKEIVEDEIRLYDKFYNFNNQFVQDFDLGVWKAPNEFNQNVIERLQKKLDEEKRVQEEMKQQSMVKSSTETAVQESEEQSSAEEQVIYLTKEQLDKLNQI